MQSVNDCRLMMDGTHLGCIWDCDPYGWQQCSVEPVKLVSYTNITDTVWANLTVFWCRLVQRVGIELLLPAYACTVFHFVADMAGQGVGVCLRISKYKRQMGIPSFHSLSLPLSVPAPASLHASQQMDPGDLWDAANLLFSMTAKI